MERGGGRGLSWGNDRGEYEVPPNSPRNNLQLWVNTLLQSNFHPVDVCVLETVEC